MKDNETKLAFIRLRSEGKSYSCISQELGISKSTCQSWEQTFKSEIEGMKQAQMEELYNAYNMKREARINDLGALLQRIDTAIEGKPLEELTLDKLLDLKLKYIKELKKEYIEPIEVCTDNTLEGLLESYNQLYMDSRRGKYSPAEIKAQLAILDGKRDAMYRINTELTKEEESGVIDFSDVLGKTYQSKLLRELE